MAMHAARQHGASVVGITISKEQAARARQRVEEAGLTDRVEIREQDYRDLGDETFDAISSIGMFEHVGEARMAEYFAVLRRLLLPQGRLLNHAISSVGGSRLPRRSFTGRYVFPDGELLDVGRVRLAMEAAGFEVRDVESLREHYALTLRRWVANLEAGWDEACASSASVGPGSGASTWPVPRSGSRTAGSASTRCSGWCPRRLASRACLLSRWLERARSALSSPTGLAGRFFPVSDARAFDGEGAELGTCPLQPPGPREVQGTPMSQLKVWIDQDLCTGDGICVELQPGIFAMHDDGLAYVKETGWSDIFNGSGTDPVYKMAEGTATVPQSHVDATIEAAEECPGECIFLEIIE